MFNSFRSIVFAGVALLLVAAIIAAQSNGRITPNDRYFRYQVTFQNPGGPLKIPDFSYRTRVSEYPRNAGLDIDITRAWSITTGSRQVVVALLDHGFSYQHEDVKDNIWNNPGETVVDANGLRKETNGVDDDHNGYVDNVMGGISRLTTRIRTRIFLTAWTTRGSSLTGTPSPPWGSSEPRATMESEWPESTGISP